MRSGLLVLLCACNQVLDLRPTTTVGPPDAPFECRGDQPPKFSTTLRQVGSQDCEEYNEAATADVAVANCRLEGFPQIAIGKREGPFTTAIGIDYPVTIGDSRVYAPRVSPDANRLYTRVDITGDFTTPETRFDQYRRDGDTWTLIGVLPFANEYNDWISNLSRDPDGRERMVLLRQNTLQEYTYDGAAWTAGHMYSAGTIVGVPYVRSVMIAPDGLHLTVTAGQGQFEPADVYWGKRASVNEPFGRLTPAPDLPVPFDSTVFMTSNCGRAYFSGLQSLFYAQQQ